MAVTRWLVDSARTRTQTDGDIVDGRAVDGESLGNWFRCRFDVSTANESGEAPGRASSSPVLMHGVRDNTGEQVRLDPGQRVEVLCAALWSGPRVFEVAGEPSPLRKRRRLIGFEAPLTRVFEPNREG